MSKKPKTDSLANGDISINLSEKFISLKIDNPRAKEEQKSSLPKSAIIDGLKELLNTLEEVKVDESAKTRIKESIEFHEKLGSLGRVNFEIIKPIDSNTARERSYLKKILCYHPQ